METYKFGTPSTAIQRPPCWGRSFEEGNRECRSCSVQGSCKDEIVRQNVNRPMYQPTAQPYYQPTQYQQPVPYQQPAPVPVPQYQPPMAISSLRRAVTSIPVQSYPATTPQQVPQVPQVPQQPQTQVPYGYGWIQDPMHYYVHTTPPPLRPQMNGESFSQRMVKNIGLAMLESMFASLFLAVRQMVWEPVVKPPRVVDVTPPPQNHPTQPQ